MERTKSTKLIQGGGSGEGFEIPAQLRTETNDSISEIVKDMKNCISLAIFREDIFDACQNKDKENWTSQL